MTAVLTSFQTLLLKTLAKTSVFGDFYLTGGTALSAFYLEHRYSDDLDFFTEVQQGIARAEGEIQKVAESLGVKLSWGRRFQTLFECVLENSEGEKLELDFALDMPNRLQPIQSGKALGMDLDNSLDIACNKLSALYDRQESKDFVDIYFILQKLFNFGDLWREACQKYPSLDLYGLALAFYKVKGIEKLPRMIKPITLDTLKSFFIRKAAELSEDFGG